ncbi:MAG: hypothetical protein QM572_06960 [Nocardioides sp.]|uniref:hypothetical protein n=1 Tax=Nocardioides sp. TaxID=35761 RepID=UPI0039E523DB
MRLRLVLPSLLALLALLATSTLAGCGGTSAYCGEVEDRQKHLSEVVASGEKNALIDALPDFRALRDKAPDDIRDEWTTVIDAVERLRRAVASKDEDATAAAATALQSDAVSDALVGVQQEVRDVCHTPLTL